MNFNLPNPISTCSSNGTPFEASTPVWNHNVWIFITILYNQGEYQRGLLLLVSFPDLVNTDVENHFQLPKLAVVWSERLSLRF